MAKARLYNLEYLDPETQRWILCETGSFTLIRERLKLARAVPGNTLTWRAHSGIQRTERVFKMVSIR